MPAYGLAKPELTVTDISVTDIKKLHAKYSNLVFDHYYDFRIKSSARNGCSKPISCTHKPTCSSSVPTKAVILSKSHTKSRLIDLSCERLLHITLLTEKPFSLVLTASKGKMW